MKRWSIVRGMAWLLLMVMLVGCAKLPREAHQAVLNQFDPAEEPHLISIRRADALPEDQEAGAEEVWCVTMAYTCWSCSLSKYRTCASNSLVRYIESEWIVAPVVTEHDWESWEARGCRREDPVVGGTGPGADR